MCSARYHGFCLHHVTKDYMVLFALLIIWLKYYHMNNVLKLISIFKNCIFTLQFATKIEF